jgi:hypothetical protein
MERSEIRERPIGLPRITLRSIRATSCSQPLRSLQKLVAALRKCGVSKKLIEKLRYRNWLRVLKKTWS